MPALKQVTKSCTWILLLAFAVGATCAEARDERLLFPIADALADSGLQMKVNPDVKLYFGKQPFPEPAENFGLYTSNKKTNFFNKSDKEACQLAFVSALISLQERAEKLGGNAVINIRSIYRKDQFISETEYECGAGIVVGGVSLRGEIVLLSQARSQVDSLPPSGIVTTPYSR
jgi:hypothetical protein